MVKVYFTVLEPGKGDYGYLVAVRLVEPFIWSRGGIEQLRKMVDLAETKTACPLRTAPTLVFAAYSPKRGTDYSRTRPHDDTRCIVLNALVGPYGNGINRQGAYSSAVASQVEYWKQVKRIKPPTLAYWIGHELPTSRNFLSAHSFRRSNAQRSMGFL